MNTGLNPADPALVAAFRSALTHQGTFVGVLFLVLLLCWGVTRAWVTADTQAAAARAAAWREPRARRLLRVGFGLLWLFDGILQAQPQMPGGLPAAVIEPAASSSPGWVQHLVNWGGAIWSYHPIEAAAASVWIQVGIGLWLNFPDWSLPFIRNLPLTMLTDGIRSIFNEGAGFHEVTMPLLFLIAEGVVFFSAGLRIFKWH